VKLQKLDIIKLLQLWTLLPIGTYSSDLIGMQQSRVFQQVMVALSKFEPNLGFVGYWHQCITDVSQISQTTVWSSLYSWTFVHLR